MKKILIPSLVLAFLLSGGVVYAGEVTPHITLITEASDVAEETVEEVVEEMAEEVLEEIATEIAEEVSEEIIEGFH